MTSLKVHENPKQSGLPGAKDVRKRFRVPGEKVCKICEDKALAHHFNVLSCESCKAFFRRNALKKSELTRCLFEGKCIISKTTRKNCAACRLKKCFDMGMKAELIFDECQKKELMKKIKENKAKQARYQDDKTENVVLSNSPCKAHSSSIQYSACLSPNNSDLQSFSSSSSPYNTSSSGGTPAGDTCETL
ncbi:vitamin D3 receptor A-like isoform X3 [Pomacea canaliculata]|nr:vitamin D3 receptor A-like isoform X3 [Pomacea canaliculata]XP_025095223.1 vitamin D3 receptor A-like isoform X3 [Pomacea canaliculata]XP_025095224.1 vitamin D3 receptor A-like isoform X3 [Pomacea canaliculata]